MTIEKINLYDYYGLSKGNASGGELCIYTRAQSVELKRKARPAVLVLPGGGYGFLSDREGEPVAIKFFEMGYCACVLSYSINTPYPTPLNEALMAVAYIKQNAEKYGVDKDNVVSIGFSAGGHLAGLLATATEDEINALPSGAKPNAAILSYPVITMGVFTHEGTRDVISNNGKIDLYKLSIENRVNKDSVPAFIWHTFEDDCVPMENSLMLANAYKQNSVPFALHIFEKGWHGMSLCNRETNDENPWDVELNYVGKWFDLAMDWLNSRGIKVKTLDK